MEKVWVLMWEDNDGASGIGGVFKKRDAAINEAVSLFAVGEEENDERLVLDGYIMIYTNRGEYTIEQRVIR